MNVSDFEFSVKQRRAAEPARKRVLEDPLDYLPRSATLEFRKGQTIYARDEPATCIYLVISGRVKVYNFAEEGTHVLLDIYQPEELFGEAAFAADAPRRDFAVALEKNTKLMTWTMAEIGELATRRPKLGIALLQLIVRRSMDLGDRVESFSTDKIATRLARALIHFSDRCGPHPGTGLTPVIPFTHELLAQYVGTSREIVTHHMVEFRRQGFLNYSRNAILVDSNAMKAALGQSMNCADRSDWEMPRQNRAIPLELMRKTA